MLDVIIIGAGISGTSVAYYLAASDLKTAILEKSNDIANGATKANSGIVHAGYDAEPGTLMARFNAEGNAMYPGLCGDLDVPFRPVGSLVLAFSPEELDTLNDLYDRGVENGIPGMEIWDGERVRKEEPHVNPHVTGALYAATAGVVSPYELAVAMAENAADHGAEIHYNAEVTAIDRREDGIYEIRCADGRHFEARAVINAAGTHAGSVHDMIMAPAFSIHPRRGEYYLLDKYADGTARHVLFQCPTKAGKGVLVAPTAHHNIIVGPNAADGVGPDAVETTADGLAEVKASAFKTIPDLSMQDVITTFSGIRAQPDTGDFVIRDYEDMPGFYDVAGIKSPGLTSAPAFGKYIAEKVSAFCGARPRKNYTPTRRKVVRFHSCSHAERAELVKQDPLYGRIICRCETVTEAEIVDCIHRSAGAHSLDSVKRRVRCGGGRCQGGFCGPKIISILARELNISEEEVLKDAPDSAIVRGRTKGEVRS